MSIYKHTYIEPYIEIPIQYKENIYTFRTCPNKCSTDNSKKYCSECGSEITTLDKIDKTKLDWVDLSDNENFWWLHNKDNMILLSNKYPFNTDVLVFELTQSIISDMIDKFKEIHKADIELLESYLKQPVTVKFGLINTYR